MRKTKETTPPSPFKSPIEYQPLPFKNFLMKSNYAVICKMFPLFETLYCFKGEDADPFKTEPLRLKFDPWHGQFNFIQNKITKMSF